MFLLKRPQIRSGPAGHGVNRESFVHSSRHHHEVENYTCASLEPALPLYITSKPSTHALADCVAAATSYPAPALVDSCYQDSREASSPGDTAVGKSSVTHRETAKAAHAKPDRKWTHRDHPFSTVSPDKTSPNWPRLRRSGPQPLLLAAWNDLQSLCAPSQT